VLQIDEKTIDVYLVWLVTVARLPRLQRSRSFPLNALRGEGEGPMGRRREGVGFVWVVHYERDTVSEVQRILNTHRQNSRMCVYGTFMPYRLQNCRKSVQIWPSVDDQEHQIMLEVGLWL